MTALEQLDADLDAYILGDIEFDPDAEPIDLGDVDAADRALRRVARIEHDMSRLEKLAAARKAQIDEWLNETVAPLEREREWFARAVEGWARAHLADQKAQTVRLPSGRVALRRTPPRLEAVADPPAEADPTLVRVSRSWDKANVKQRTSVGPELPGYDAPDGFVGHAVVNADGEVVAGVVYLVRSEASCTIRAGS